MGETKVWLTEDELEKLLMSVSRIKDRAIIELGAYMGLRVNEIARAKVRDIREYPDDDNNIDRFLRVRGKRTQQKSYNNLKKEREVYMHDKVYSDLRIVMNNHNTSDKDSLIPTKDGKHYTVDGLRNRIYVLSKRACEQTEIDKFDDLSSHDLRRYFAHYNLVEMGKSVEVVMDQGGWKNYSSIKPYLDKPSRSKVVDEMNK